MRSHSFTLPWLTGRLFTANDWERVAMIAEGNPDESTVGMFGVGFYSVFSLTESPVITSGDRMVAFVWKGTQLTTFGAQLRPDQVTDKTCGKPRAVAPAHV